MNSSKVAAEIARCLTYETPNTNHQTPENDQTPNSYRNAPAHLGAWCFFGVWNLVLGAFSPSQPSTLNSQLTHA